MIARKHLHIFPMLSIAAIACVALAGASSLAQTQSAGGAPASGVEPREIPVPPIATKLGTLPGVDALPTRTAMPDVMVMNDGTPSRPAAVGRAAGGDAAHAVVLRRRADAAGAGERQGAGDSV